MHMSGDILDFSVLLCLQKYVCIITKLRITRPMPYI